MKRTDPKPIGAYLNELFKSPNIASKIAEGSLPETWRKVVGADAAEQTGQIRLVNGTLHVHLRSGIVRSELMMQRQALVRAINAEAGMELVRNIIIR